MSNTPTPPETAPDPEAWEPERAMNTIRQQREEIKALKAARGNLQSIIRQAIDNGSLPANANPTDPAEPAADPSKLKELTIHAALVDAMVDAGVDRKLTMAALQMDKALDGIDPASEPLEDDLAELLDVTLARYPQLKVRGSDVLRRQVARSHLVVVACKRQSLMSSSR